MKLRVPILAAALALAALSGSCAVADGPGQAAHTSEYSPPVSPARLGLPPAYRVFYDELQDMGDWELIEPYGWCFRPRVNFVAWRPYEDGWWEASSYWGWIWNSNEEFGWITYHYGSWFYDEYQGWVWQPGGVWGPAWVAWVSAGEFVGWAPLAPSAYNDFSRVPDGPFTFAPVSQFTAHDVASNAVVITRLPAQAAMLKPIVNVGHAQGTAFNKGPALFDLQQMGVLVTPRADATSPPRVKITAPAPQGEADLLSRSNRIGTAAIVQLRAFREQGISPPPAPRGLRPASTPAPAKRVTGKPAPRHVPAQHQPAAPADSTRRVKHVGGAADSTRHD